MKSNYYDILSADPVLKRLFADSQPYELTADDNIPVALYRAIMNQQLSTKVADVIFKRFLHIYGDHIPLPQQVVDTQIDQLRSIGLSNAKAGYIRNIAQFDIDNGLSIEKLQAMDDNAIFDYLGAIKGVGKWTIHLLLMFSLGREDVFIADDLGVQNAMAELFNLERSDRKKLKSQIIEISQKWSPYRSYLCIHLWQWLNNR